MRRDWRNVGVPPRRHAIEGARPGLRIVNIRSAGERYGLLNDDLLAVVRNRKAVLDAELGRQRDTLEMIASENFAPRAVLQAGLRPDKTASTQRAARSDNYYGGFAVYADVAESRLPVSVLEAGLRRRFASTFSHAGAQANAAARVAWQTSVTDPGPVSLAHGGHLTPRHHTDFSGKKKHYRAVAGRCALNREGP